MPNLKNRGFTLIEILVVIAVIGILIALSAVAYQAIRKSSRDTKRRADLQDIRSALEIYRTDCGRYPAGSNNRMVIACGAGGNQECVWGSGRIVGSGSASCATGNTYMSQVPKDPLDPTYSYKYYQTGAGYSLCAYLENASGSVDCDGISSTNDFCGNNPCNYMVSSP